MSSNGESSITKITRTGKRQKEFDSLFYMRDSIRRQYILDRYLKRLPKGDVKLNTAFQTRAEIGTDTGDDEDLREAYQRGWIGYEDILKYYKPNSKGDFPPNLLKRQDIIMKNLIEKTVENKTLPSSKSPSSYKKRKINLEDKKEFEAFFKSLEKIEKVRSTKTDDILLSKGFSKLSVNNKKEKNKFDVMKKQRYNLKKIISKTLEDPKSIVSKKIPMWKKEQNAENYKNEKYKKSEEKKDKYFSRGRLPQNLTEKEKLKNIEEDLKFLGLVGLKRNILELKTKENKRRPTIFLGKTTLKRKASNGSRKSSVTSSRKSSNAGSRGSVGSSRKSSVNSVSGYSSPSSAKSEKDLWSDY